MSNQLIPYLFKHPIRMYKGLFSANDIFQLSGADDHRKPYKWLQTERAQELIFCLAWKAGLHDYLPEDENDSQSAISAAGREWFRNIPGIIQVNNGGKNPGVWMCEELIVAFAMWINTRFHLYVIQCFTDYQHALRSRRNIKGLHKNVTDALKDTRAEQGKDTKGYHYSNEAFMINSVLVGMNYRDWLKLNDLEDAGFRDALSDEQLARLEKLEEYDAFLIEEGIEYPKRKEKLEAKNKRIIQRKIKINACNASRKITRSTLRQRNRTQNSHLWRHRQ
ncbi:KilA-N domain-containing protein [Escherichia coli]|nr:KilA-N domain-containing protein [Escherichia coli]